MDPNPAGEGLRPLHGLGVQSAGSPHVGRALWPWLQQRGCIQYLWAWQSSTHPAAGIQAPRYSMYLHVHMHIASLGSCWRVECTSPVR